MRHVKRWVATTALTALLVTGWVTAPAQAGPVVSDLPTLSITVNAAEFAAVNADPVHQQRTMVGLELTDPANPANNLAVNDGMTELKGRGNFTWTLDKKGYQIKFADGNSQNMLGMGAARAWVLLANHADASLMRNKVAFDLAEEFGMPYTTESRWVDLVINGRNWGNYLLAEKVEVKKTRVDLKNNQGVLVEQDYNYGTGDPVAYRTPRSKSWFVLKDAKGGNPDTLADLSTPQYANTKAGWDDFVAKMTQLDNLLADPSANWAAITQIIDVESFVKMFLVYEFTENQEISRSSVHFYRDGPSDKIHAGPVWDFDVSMGNFDFALYGRGGNPEVDYVINSVNWRPIPGDGNDWFPKLLSTTAFQGHISAMYPGLRSRIDDVPNKILQYRDYLKYSAGANFARWPILGKRTLLPYGSRSYASTFDGEVWHLLNWVNKRVAYMDAKYAGTTGDATACAVSTPVGNNSDAGTYNPVNPCRMLDTRTGNGQGTAVAVPANSSINLKVTGRGGVPTTAGAVALNVTVTQAQRAGFVTVYPKGSTLPEASNINFAVGQDVPNHAIVKIGADGSVTLQNSSAGTIHLVADLAGYFAGGGTASLAGAFQSNAPTRILDTRLASDVTAGLPVRHGQPIDLQVTGAHGDVTIPADASAVVMNVTVANPTKAGFVTVYPKGTTKPDASNVNFGTGQAAIANLVTVKVGTGGGVSLSVSTDTDPTGGSSHLVADIAGYYVGGTPTQPGTFVAMSPKRILDSRTGAGMVPKTGITSLTRMLNNYETIVLDVAGAIPSPAAGVGAAVMNVTVANPTAPGFVIAHPDGTTRPQVSNVNFRTGVAVPNMTTVRTGTNGKVDFYQFTAGQTNLLADLAGYYRS